jgi:hypothetical protein
MKDTVQWPLHGVSLNKSLNKWLTNHPGSLFHTLIMCVELLLNGVLLTGEVQCELRCNQ